MSDSITAMKRSIRLLVNTAVANGEIDPADALAALMSVSVTYIAQVRDDAERAAYVATVSEMFGTMVAMTRGEPAVGMNIAPGTETAQ